jgi:uncharacterized membrane protein
MLTPVFHPNFDDAMVCIGDFWAASEGLDDLIIRIGRMISYQEYNTKSPLNGLAAKWAAQNPNLLPVDPRNIAPPLQSDSASASESTQVPIAPPSIAATPESTVLSFNQSEVPVPFADIPPPEDSQPDLWSQKISIE